MLFKILATFIFFIAINNLFSQNIILQSSSKNVNIVWDNYWSAGNMATIALYPIEKNFTATVVLLDKKSGKVKSKTTFYHYKLNDTNDKKNNKKLTSYDIMLANLGLSTYLDDKECSLKITINDGISETSKEFDIKPSKKSYKKLVLKMGEQGTKIATGKRNIKREKQAARFYKALVSFSGKVFFEGKMKLPVSKPYKNTGEFGLRRTFVYTNGAKGGDFHNGLDFAGLKIGTPIHAIMGGKVILAEHRIVTGGTVIVEHLPGVYSLYYHMKNVRAVVGGYVRQGSIVGTLGNTGFTTGPHLHLGMYANGVDIDPAQFLERPIFDRSYFLNHVKLIDKKIKDSIVIGI